MPGRDTPSAERIPQNAGQLDFADLGVRLLRYARLRARGNGWRLSGKDGLAAGKAIEDIVQSALLTLVDPDSKRKWDPNNEPDPFAYLRQTVNSLLDHLRRSVDNRRHEREDVSFPNSGNVPDPEALLILREHAEVELKAADLLLNVIGGDHDLHAIYEAHLDGVFKPADIAERMQVPVTKIYNLSKKFRRHWLKALKEAYLVLGFERGDDVRQENADCAS